MYNSYSRYYRYTGKRCSFIMHCSYSTAMGDSLGEIVDWPLFADTSVAEARVVAVVRKL